MKKTVERLTTGLMIALVIWGVGLRLYRFGAIPTDLNRDETALAYNAWSIAQFGIDEWGRRYPLMFESFGDYKLPGYIYTLALSFGLTGDNDAAVRWPSLLAGIGLIGLSYGWGRKLTQKPPVGWLAAALVAVSPWAIFYSRTAFEAHLALFWLVLTLYLTLDQVKPGRLLAMTVTYFLAILSYNSPLLLLPVVVLFVASLPHKSWREKGIISLPLVLVALVTTWGFWPLINQKQNITIFTDPTIWSQINQNYSQAENAWQRLGATKYTAWTGLMLKHWSQSLGYKFLVVRGGAHPWHSIPGYGHMFWTTWFWFWLGAGLIYLKKIPDWRAGCSLIILAMGALLPALITVDAPHATRSLLFLWGLLMIGAISLPKLKGWALIPLVTLTLESLLFGYHYFKIFPQEAVKTYPSGIATLATKLTSPEKPVAITNASRLSHDLMSEQIYIWFLWYDRIAPEIYLQQQRLVGRDAAGMIRVQQFGRYSVYNDPNQVPDDNQVIERTADNIYHWKI